MLMLEADRLAAVVAELRAHGVERSAVVAERFARNERVNLNGRAAVLTVGAKIIKPFEPSALALPVAYLKLHEV